jgi:hypothetical protein
MGGACSTNAPERNAYRILGKPEGKRSLGRPRHNGIKMDLREREDGMVWIGLIWLKIRISGGLL